MSALAEGGLRDRLLLQGLQDVDLVDTDDQSRLLSRNDGDLAGGATLRLWLAGQIMPRFQAVAVGRFETGRATLSGASDADLEQGFLRWIAPGESGIIIDAGKVVVPLGDFARRYLSNVNPLIGAPDAYGLFYPVGIVASGKSGWFDYRLTVFDRPVVNPKYVPDSDRNFRPGVALGVTPMIGLRVGAYYTRGTYLGEGIEPYLPGGDAWDDFEQEITGVQLEFTRGYFELHADLAYSSYDVPTQNGPSRGLAWFVEPKYTWTPRLFTALRLEQNDYPYISPVSSSFWIGNNADFIDVEVGVGFRASADLLLKASARVDEWPREPGQRVQLEDGYAFAFQLSYRFDVFRWFERPQ